MVHKMGDLSHIQPFLSQIQQFLSQIQPFLSRIQLFFIPNSVVLSWIQTFFYPKLSYFISHSAVVSQNHPFLSQIQLFYPKFSHFIQNSAVFIPNLAILSRFYLFLSKSSRFDPKLSCVSHKQHFDDFIKKSILPMSIFILIQWGRSRKW